MELIARTLVDPATYRRLAYLLSALVLGPVWFTALVTVWSLCLGLAITPFVIPTLIVLAFMTRGFAAVEAEMARSLLDVEASAPAPRPSRPGFWGWLAGQFSGGFWRAQAYLMIRWVAGFPVAVAAFALLALALGMLFAPAWVPFVHGGAQLGFWRPHTFLESLPFVPVGALAAPGRGGARAPRRHPVRGDRLRLAQAGSRSPAGADGALARSPQRARASRSRSTRGRRGDRVRPGADLGAGVPRLLLADLGAARPSPRRSAIHGWLVLSPSSPALVGRFRGSRALAATAGVGALLAQLLHGDLGGHRRTATSGRCGRSSASRSSLAALARRGRAHLAPPSRAGRADRDARDHPGRRGRRPGDRAAPDRARPPRRRPGPAGRARHEPRHGRAEARRGPRARAASCSPRRASGAEQALRELRDLARGIHPPVLADRGLEAALRLAGAARRPLPVDVVGRRRASARRRRSRAPPTSWPPRRWPTPPSTPGAQRRRHPHRAPRRRARARGARRRQRRRRPRRQRPARTAPPGRGARRHASR